MAWYRILIGGQKYMRSGRHVFVDRVSHVAGFVLVLCLFPLIMVVALPIFLLLSIISLIMMIILFCAAYKIRRDLKVQSQSMNHAFSKYVPNQYADSKKTIRGSTFEGEVERSVIRSTPDS